MLLALFANADSCICETHRVLYKKQILWVQVETQLSFFLESLNLLHQLSKVFLTLDVTRAKLLEVNRDLASFLRKFTRVGREILDDLFITVLVA
jgi:hypothetical protein